MWSAWRLRMSPGMARRSAISRWRSALRQLMTSAQSKAPSPTVRRFFIVGKLIKSGPDQHSPSFSSVALAAAVDLAAVLMAARKGRSPGQGDQGFLRRNFQKKQLSEIGSLSLR